MKAFEIWQISVEHAVCLDIGASTGGFTEVLLANGAAKVYALDVGHGQLEPTVANNANVVDMPNRNIRNATKDWFNNPIDFISTDVSFISLEYVLPQIYELLVSGGKAVVLIKPQFELKGRLFHGGIVRDESLHKPVINKITNLAISAGLTPIDTAESPICGSGGNREFLLFLRKENKT